MKLLEYAIALLLTIIFVESFVTGSVIHKMYIEQAKVSQLQTNTLLAMSLAQLSDVTVTPRVL